MEFFNKLKKPIKMVAPMVGCSEQAWRVLARENGADICYTEMVHTENFLKTKSDPKCNRWFSTSAADRPLVIQVCGNDPERMVEAAKILEPFCDAIDINFGCPQNIAKSGKYGSYLQDDWELIARIVSAMSSALSVPLFCKIRVFEDIQKSIEYAKMFENNGCSLLVVHGRRRSQRGKEAGFASWKHIKEIKRALSIPVIANGNIAIASDIDDCLEYTGCDGVMVAETHLFNPLIFTDLEMPPIQFLRKYLQKSLEIPESATVANVRYHFFKTLNMTFNYLPEFRIELSKLKK